MSERSNPALFAVAQTAKIDPDADWMRVAEKLPRPASWGQSTKQRTPYIPAIPLAFLRSVAPAGDSLELLLAVLAVMRMSGTREIAIGPALWARVGDPSKRVRTRLLRQLARLPSSVCTLTARNGHPHLLKAGMDWPARIQEREPVDPSECLGVCKPSLCEGSVSASPAAY